MSGGGSGNGSQSSEVESPIKFQAAVSKENLVSSVDQTKDQDHLSELSEKTSVSASLEELVDVQQFDTSSVDKTVDSYPSLPDLLLPEAAYKKQSDTDTDTGEYESAADTYESATETDHSEVATPGEKFTNQVFDEDVKVQQVPILDRSAEFGASCIKDSSLYTEQISTLDPNFESLHISTHTEDEKHQIDSSCSEEITFTQDVALARVNETVVDLQATNELDLSLCKAFSNLHLSTPGKGSFESTEVQLRDEKTEEIISVLETSDSPLKSVQIVSPTYLEEKEGHVIPDLQSFVHDNQENDKQTFNQKFIHGIADNNSFIPTSETLTQCNTSGVQAVDIPQKDSPAVDFPVLNEGEVILNPSDGIDSLEASIEEQEVDCSASNKLVEKTEALSECEASSFNSKHSVDQEENKVIIEDDVIIVDSSGLALKESVEISDHHSEPNSNICEHELNTDSEPILIVGETKGDNHSEPYSNICEHELNTDSEPILIVGENELNTDSEPILLVVETKGDLDSRECQCVDNSENILVCDDKKPETFINISKSLDPVLVSTPNVDQLNSATELLAVVSPDIQSVKSDEHDNQIPLPGGTVDIPNLPVSEVYNSKNQSEKLPPSLTQELPPVTSLTEQVVGDVCPGIYPQDLLQSCNLHEVHSNDLNKLDQLIEICNRQQQDLNQSEVLFEQEATLGERVSSSHENPVSRTFSTNFFAADQDGEISILNESLVKEENIIDSVEEERGEFEDIALEASKVAQEIINSTLEVEFEPDTETYSALSSRMSESEDSSLHTGSPLQSRTSLLNRTSQNEKNSQDSEGFKFVRPEENQSEAGPEIAEASYNQSEDVFKDSAAFDFLSDVVNTQSVHDLRKQSLYMKFDPLAQPVSLAEKVKPLSPLEPSRVQHSSEVMNDPGKAQELVEKLISITPTPKKQESMAKRGVPKQLFRSKEEEVEAPCPQEQHSDTKVDVASSIRETSTAPSKENSVQGLSEAEVQMLREVLTKNTGQQRQTKENQKEDELKAELHELKEVIGQLEEADKKKDRVLSENSQSLKQMSLILEEYEKTISRLVAEKEHEKQAHSLEISRLTKEKDTMSTHLENIEIAFSDVHQKYEKSKQVIQGFIKNEEALRASLSEYESTIKKQEQKYDVLKSHAMAQLENANEELNTVQRNHEVELSKLRAMLKKAELKVTSLEEAIEQKTKENRELLVICDELIGVQQGNNPALS